MDLYCQHCSEPWDVHSVYHEFTKEEKDDFLKGISCPVCEGKGERTTSIKSLLMEAGLSVSGDDLDGLAADLEDAEFWLD